MNTSNISSLRPGAQHDSSTALTAIEMLELTWSRRKEKKATWCLRQGRHAVFVRLFASIGYACDAQCTRIPHTRRTQAHSGFIGSLIVVTGRTAVDSDA